MARTTDDILAAVDRALVATEVYLLTSIKSNKAARPELLAQLDALQQVGIDVINEVKKELDQ